MKKRLLAMLLCVAMVASLLTVGAAAETVDETLAGTCGDNVYWSFDEDTATLNISGHGEMYDYDEPADVPYIHLIQNKKVQKVVVGDNITHLGNYAFYEFQNSFWGYYDVLESVTIGESVKTVGNFAISSEEIDSLVFPSGVTEIGYGIAVSPEGTITVPSTVTRIGTYYDSISINEHTEQFVNYSGAFACCREVIVEDGNERYFSRDGVLYEKCSNGKYSLLYYPEGKPDTSYSVLSNTQEIVMGAFLSNDFISQIVMPNSLKRIGMEAFLGCDSLSDIQLNAGLEKICASAFWNCVSLTRLDIPASVNYFAEEYLGLNGLEDEMPQQPNLDIYFYGSVAPEVFNAEITEVFMNYYGRWDKTYVTIYYPQSSSGWQKYIEEFDEHQLYLIHPDGSKEGLDVLNFEPWAPGPVLPQIVELSPANGATISENATTDFMVTYDTPISVTETSWGSFVNLDLSKGGIKIHRSSDDYVVYTVEEDVFLNDYHNIEGTYSNDIMAENGNTLVFSPFNVHTLFDSGAEYYITIDEGVFTFENGMPNPEIKKGDWTFSTGQGTFKFLASDGTKDLEYTFDFTEDYFNVNSYYYNHDFAKTSLALALSAFNSYDAQRSGYDKSKAAQNVIAMLRDMGFEDINVDSYEGRPTANSIAQAIGHKSINTRGLEYTVLAVAIRGGGYEAEWSNNFQVGSDRHHIGFDSSANTVVSEIIDYIENELNDKEKENLKIWITGYSRGAAVANLTGHKINTLINNSTFDSLNMGIGDVYVYTFATPMGAAGEKTIPRETNIYNIVNPVDVVPKLAPSAWGFYRYGVTYMLPSQETDSKLFEANKDEATNIAGSLTGIRTTKAFTWQGSALDSVLEAFDLMEPDGSISMTLQNTLAEHFEDKYRGGSGGVGLFGIIKDIWSTGSTTKAWLTLDFASLAKTYLLKPAVLDGAAETLDQVLSTVEMAHYPETYLAWMYALDAEEFGHGIYRKDYINCPVDVTVYDENGNNVAGFKDEEPYFEADGYVTAYVDENEQKVLVFPNDREYRVEITPYDSGTLSYTVEEYSAADNETRRVVSYQRIPIEVGDKFEGVVSAITDTESETIYTFSKNEDGELEPTVDQSGNEVEKLTVNVSVTGNGQANGGGTFLNGEYALLTATPNSGSSFIGWYVDGNLLSTETELRILVDDDNYVTAVFTSGGNIPAVDVPSNQPEEPEEPTDSLPFTDVSVGDWFYGYVAYVYVNGLMDGTSATTFEPNANMTRAMVWAILARVDGETVTGTNWVETAREWAMANGVSDGTDADGYVTREQLATMLWRYAGEPASSYSLSAFTDAASVSGYAATAMAWAVEHGIISGVTDTTLVPQGTATRAQCAAMLMRFVESDF